MRYNKGDIIVCAKNKVNSYEYDLIIGDKYEVIGSILIHGGIFSDSRVALDVRNVNNHTVKYLLPDNLFIKLDVYREFKLRQILN